MGKYVASGKGERLNSLGRKYIESISDSQFDKYGKFDLDKRTAFQIETANEIVVGSRWFLCDVANKLLSGKGWRMGKGGRVSLRGFNLEAEELIPEGIISVLENLHMYKPEKGGMTTFIGQYAAARMYETATKYTDIPLKRRDFERARFAVRRAIKNETNLQESVFSYFSFGEIVSMSENLVMALSLGVGIGSVQNIDEPAFAYDSKSDSWQSVYLRDKGFGPEDYVKELDIIEKVRNVIADSSLSERDGYIVLEKSKGRKSWEIGEEFAVTRQRIDKIVKDAKIKLRKPLECLVV